jgi:hypothetical protein
MPVSHCVVVCSYTQTPLLHDPPDDWISTPPLQLGPGGVLHAVLHGMSASCPP